MDADCPEGVSAKVSVHLGAKLLQDTYQHSSRVCWAARTCVPPCKGLPERLGELSRAESSAKMADLGAAPHHPAGDKIGLGMQARSELDEGWKGLLSKKQGAGTARSDRANFVVTVGMKGERARRTDAIAPEDLMLGEKTPSQIYCVPTLLKWFPSSKVIRKFRHARGPFVCASWRSTVPSSSSLPTAKPNQSFLHSLPTSPRHPRLARASNPRFKQEKLYSYRYCLLRFEGLLADLEKHADRPCGFLEVDSH
jgi:hypothetical protein